MDSIHQSPAEHKPREHVNGCGTTQDMIICDFGNNRAASELYDLVRKYIKKNVHRDWLVDIAGSGDEAWQDAIALGLQNYSPRRFHWQMKEWHGEWGNSWA